MAENKLKTEKMNLEQLKNRQEGLNGLLDAHINSLEKVVMAIGGGYDKPEGDVERPQCASNGLIESMESSQLELEEKINEVGLLVSRLNKLVYTEITNQTNYNI